MDPRVSDGLSSRLLAEVEAILDREELDTGRLWRLRNEELANAELMSRLRVNVGQLGTLKMQLRVLREGFVPSSPSTAEKGAHKVRGWLKREVMSDELRIHLTRLEAVLTAAIEGRTAERGREPEAASAAVVEWPTIEWVKVPVDLGTGLPNGAPVAMRHFADCDHWYRNDDGSWVGAPPSLATDEQMANLPACKDCVSRARRSGNDLVGPRLADVQAKKPTSEQAFPLPMLLGLEGTDLTATVRLRREQSHLRKHLLAGASEAECALCGRLLPSSLLVAAHIVPRRHLDDAARLDFESAAMLTCTLGCDALFELGYISVDDSGAVAALRETAIGDVADAVQPLIGRLTKAFTEATGEAFARHRALHTP